MDRKEKLTTEQLILQAAEEEFLLKGFDGARTTTIAERAGVTHAMLHYYFRTKEQLFERIVAKITTLVMQTILAAMGDPQKPIVERIQSGVASHFDLVAAHPLLPRFFLNEVVLRPERYHLLDDSLKEKITELFAQLQTEADRAAREGEMEAVDMRQLFLSIVSLNVFPFLALPFAGLLLGDLVGDREKFLAARKAEAIETILRRIQKPKP